MKKYIPLLAIILFSCGPKPIAKNEEFRLYEVLKVDEYSGSKVRFYEVITDSQEFKMILNDPELKNKVSAKDVLTSNFILLHMGEKSTGGYRLDVENVHETDDQIIVKVKEISPQGMATTAITYPLTVVKINSKKPIIFQD
ncbi:MAG: protease complex subunit PrcB family protein [Flavobacterium sp.]